MVSILMLLISTVSNQGVTKMSYTVPKFRNEQILAMTDDELFTELKKMKRIIHKKRKVGPKHRKGPKWRFVICKPKLKNGDIKFSSS